MRVKTASDPSVLSAWMPPVLTRACVTNVYKALQYTPYTLKRSFTYILLATQENPIDSRAPRAVFRQ